MLTSKESCGINSLLFLKRIFTFLLGVMAGTGFYIKASFAYVCFLPSMRGGECGMSMENISLGLSGKCPEGYIEKNGKCIYNCQGYTYSSTAANEMMSNNFECEKCPGANLYKCSRCKTGYRKKVMSNTCVHICETQGYTVTAEEKQSKTDKNFTCVQCANGDFYKCACPDGLEENSEGICANNECIEDGYTLNEEEKTQCTETNRVIETCPDSSSEYKYYTCGECEEGYLDVNGECKQRKCEADFLEGNVNDGCHSCQSCKEVNNKTYYKCTESVQTGYKLEDGKCLCDTEKGFSMSNGSCVCSSANHLVLSGNKCVCATGYTLSGGVCKPSDETLYCGDNRESGKLKDRLANDVFPENMSPYRCYAKGNVVGGQQRYNEICCLSDLITQQDYAECTNYYKNEHVGESGDPYDPIVKNGCHAPVLDVDTENGGAYLLTEGDSGSGSGSGGNMVCSDVLANLSGFLPNVDPYGNKGVIIPFVYNDVAGACSLMSRYLVSSRNTKYYISTSNYTEDYNVIPGVIVQAGYSTGKDINNNTVQNLDDPYYFCADVMVPKYHSTTTQCYWGYGSEGYDHNYYYNNAYGSYNSARFQDGRGSYVSYPDHGFTRAQLAFYDACCAVQLADPVNELLVGEDVPDAACYRLGPSGIHSVVAGNSDDPHAHVDHKRPESGYADIGTEPSGNYTAVGALNIKYVVKSMRNYCHENSLPNCLHPNGLGSTSVHACDTCTWRVKSKTEDGDIIYSPSGYQCTAQ